jgi:hypothetical protein
MQGIHYMVHKTNLVVQVLSKLNMVFQLESLFQTLMPTLVKALKDICNSKSLLRSWKPKE